MGEVGYTGRAPVRTEAETEYTHTHTHKCVNDARTVGHAREGGRVHELDVVDDVRVAAGR